MRSRFVTFVGAVAVAVLVLVLVLGSCGGDDRPTIEARTFVELGTDQVDMEPLWLDDPAAVDSALRTFTGGEAADALRTPAAEGTRRAAFLLGGCSETGAELTIEGSTLDATLTGGDEGTDCAAMAYFLAVFDIPDDEIPPGARLA